MLLLTGGASPAFNRLVATGHRVDLDEIDRLATVADDEGAPWSLWLRDEPEADVLKIAGDHGHTERGVEPLMAVTRADARIRGPRPGGPNVRRITSGERQLHLDLIATAFGIPAELFGQFLAAPLMDAPWASTYVAELDGVTVATAYAVRHGDFVGVYTVSVPPQFRGRGYGRLVTETVMTDAFAAGATAAFLQSSEMGLPLYESIGFQTVETWTYLT